MTTLIGFQYVLNKSDPRPVQTKNNLFNCMTVTISF